VRWWGPRPVHPGPGHRRLLANVLPLPGAACPASADAGVIRNRGSRMASSTASRSPSWPSRNAELRRLTLRNTGDRVRRFDITSFAELALNTLPADAAHPGFSRLFVQTERVEEADALLAWRRLRSTGDRPLVAVHTLVGGAAGVSWETDRARFVGRGRPHSAPAALVAGSVDLPGTAGPVLDPVFAMRRTRRAAAGGGSIRHSGARRRHDRRGRAGRSQRTLATRAPSMPCSPVMPPPVAAADAWRHAARRTMGMPAAWRCNIVADPRRSSCRHHRRLHARWEPRRHPAVESIITSRCCRRRRAAESLRFHNGIGGFTADGAEYVMLLSRGGHGEVARPPLPWVNVLASEEAGCIVSESGATFTWAGTVARTGSRRGSMTPSATPTARRCSCAMMPAASSGRPLPGPRPGRGGYEVRHGFGYTRFLHESAGLLQETVVFVPENVPGRVVRLRVTNRGAAPRRLSAWSFAQLVLGGHEADTRGLVRTSRDDAASGAVLAVQPQRGEFSERVAFALAACSVDAEAIAAWTTDRGEFIGAAGPWPDPKRSNAACSGRLCRRRPRPMRRAEPRLHHRARRHRNVRLRAGRGREWRRRPGRHRALRRHRRRG
jgi:N,N'-diacetylchitobiose phosphorylase